MDKADWHGLKPAEQQERLNAYLAADRRRGFDLTRAPLLRVALHSKGRGAHNVVWSFHHLLLDGWSRVLVLKEVFACYEALCRGVDPQLENRRPYRDYIAWLQEQDSSEAEKFWRETLKGFTAPTPLVVVVAPAARGGRQVDADRAAGDQDIHGERMLQMSKATTDALQSLARQHQFTVNTLVQGAWALLLSHYSGQADVVFGAVVSGRSATLRGAEAMVGLLMNTLPVRVHVPGEEELVSWLTRLNAHRFELRQYEYSSFARIHGWSEVPPGVRLFETILAFENYHVDPEAFGRGPNGILKIADIHSEVRTNFPLALFAWLAPELCVRCAYDKQRFDAGTVKRLLNHFETLLEGMANDPNRRLSQLPLRTESERHQVTSSGFATELSEIGATLDSHEAVREAVVLAARGETAVR